MRYLAAIGLSMALWAGTLWAQDIFELVQRGDALLAKGAPQLALVEYEKALDLGAGSALFLNRLAGLYMQTTAYDKAAAVLHKSLREDPKQLPVYSALGEAFLAMGKIDSAVFYVEQARIIAPASSTIYSSLGFLYMQKGQVERAREQLDRAVELDEKNAEAHRLYGFYYSQLDSLDQAIASYERMSQLQPNEVEPFNNMAFLHASAKRYSEALKYYKMAKERAQDPYLAQAIEGNIEAVRAIVAGKMRARYILVKNRIKAEEVLAKLGQGLDFALVAQHNSIAPNAQDGSDLGFFGPGELMPAFEETVMQLEVGELSEIVEISLGFMIIQRLN